MEQLEPASPNIRCQGYTAWCFIRYATAYLADPQLLYRVMTTFRHMALGSSKRATEDL